ncbi:hypothetical protein ACFP2T_35080 [Plantactinospora solaniradicis]|uniref:Uncharacterized protein n=1 Tax=Plantactinospora solaniradicis TaxID=1723736 RepID=A0ABW1KKC9_9ACTN
MEFAETDLGSGLSVAIVPSPNCFVARSGRNAREECIDHLVIYGERRARTAPTGIRPTLQ